MKPMRKAEEKKTLIKWQLPTQIGCIHLCNLFTISIQTEFNALMHSQQRTEWRWNFEETKHKKFSLSFKKSLKRLLPFRTKFLALLSVPFESETICLRTIISYIYICVCVGYTLLHFISISLHKQMRPFVLHLQLFA